MKYFILLAPILLGAAGPPTDPDWPCVQRLVPHLTAGTLWAGPPPAADWRANPQIMALVQKVAQRSVPADRAAAAVGTFADTVPAASRPETFSELFTGLVDETNDQRTAIIDRLREINRRQRRLATAASKAESELDALPTDAPAAQRAETSGRRLLLIREYDEIAHTLRYACEAPVAMEAKLGVLSQELRQRLP